MFPQQVIIMGLDKIQHGRQVVGKSDSYICLARLDTHLYPIHSSFQDSYGHLGPHVKWSTQALGGFLFCDDFRITLFLENSNPKTQCRQQAPPHNFCRCHIITVSVHFTNIRVLSLCSLLHLDLKINDWELQYR